jgi:hypothetical protein
MESPGSPVAMQFAISRRAHTFGAGPLITFAFALAAVAVSLVLVHHFRDALHDPERPVVAVEQPHRIQGPIPGDDLVDTSPEPSAWTALDDFQLNRLLEESS